MTGLTTSGSTFHPSDGALPAHLCVPDTIAAEPNRASLEGIAAAANLCSSDSVSNVAATSNIDNQPDTWREEVAARLERYRTRRKPRSPRYPSLLLPFDAPQTWGRTLPPTGSEPFGSAATASLPHLDLTSYPTEESATAAGRGYEYSTQPEAPDQFANVIEFPRSAAIPVFNGSELAEPIFDRPRIVEAPEILPPPPALGGMLIEPAPDDRVNRRNAADHPDESASIARRMLAVLVDGAIQVTALAAFTAIFLRLNPDLTQVRGPIPLLAGALTVAAIILWITYESFFVIYSGTTPGLRAARLRLAKFDGKPLSRRQRRWRVLASFLSAFSAGLGYLWCLLDEDALCWHDRITRTHIQPVD